MRLYASRILLSAPGGEMVSREAPRRYSRHRCQGRFQVETVPGAEPPLDLGGGVEIGEQRVSGLQRLSTYGGGPFVYRLSLESILYQRPDHDEQVCHISPP